MSETPKKLNLDAALREWPDVEKSPVELDESAQAVVTRIQAGERGKTAATLSDENLFAAPLGQSAEDGHNSAAPGGNEREVPKMTMADRERDRRSLQDLAKMAQTGLTPPPPSARSAPSGIQPAASSAPGAAKGEDSGLIDLRAVNSEPAPQVAPAPSSSGAPRAQGLASQGLFDEEPASMKQPAPSLPPMPASIPPQSMPAHAYSQTPSAPPASVAPVPASMAPQASYAPAPAHASSSQPALQQKKGNGAVIALVFGGVVALSAAAAGTFFFLKMKKPVESTPTAAVQTPPPDVKPAAPQATAAATETAPATEPTLDPNALPTATPDKVAVAPKTAGKPATHAAAAPAPAPEPKPEAKLTQKDLPPASTGPAGDLGAAMGKAVGDDGKPKPEMTQAAGTNVPAGSVPQKPSQGAVTGAIGAVLPAARVCLGPDDPVSHASIVFGSDGKVQSVTVTGAAQGKMAEGCIKDALMKAKVGPFAEPSYSTRVTVRHQ